MVITNINPSTTNINNDSGTESQTISRNNIPRSTTPTSDLSSSVAPSAPSFASAALRSVKDFYEFVEEEDRIRTLLVMSVGLEVNLCSSERLRRHVGMGNVRKGQLLLRAKEYTAEIIRRAKLMETDELKHPRPGNWGNPKKIDWLEKNVVSGFRQVRYQ